MSVLVIDNGGNSSDTSDLLVKLCAGKGGETSVKVVSGVEFADTLAGTNLDEYDSFVITGAYQDGPIMNEAYFMPEIELVMSVAKPILGAGSGFEIICYAFGAQLQDIAEQVEAATKVTPTDAGAKIFQGTDPIKLTESTRWNVDELPRELQVLARSDSGIEAVKHKLRPIYGLQLLPKDFAYPSDGNMVFKNILV